MNAGPSLLRSTDCWAGAESELGLYLHVPFCLRKCPYCSFFSEPVRPHLVDPYVQAVLIQISRMAEPAWTGNMPVTTIFIGGGTPSVLPVGALADFLRKCRRDFALADGSIECSVEVNPATVGDRDLKDLVRAGFNRLSVGVQSFSDAELVRIGRPYSAADARTVLVAARKAGFANCNIDLMFGLPGQTPSSWCATLENALQLAPEHLAIYELTIEAGTPFAGLAEHGQLELPTEEEVLAMMALTVEMTAAAGFRRYEISNYALPGRECRHNINYWRNGSYIGLGAGAVSCLAGRRYRTVEDIDTFCRLIESGHAPWADVEELDREARFRETVVMGLRLTAGIPFAALEKRFGLNPAAYYGKTLSRMERQGLVTIADDRLRLTASGLNLANQVMAELV